MDNENNIMKLIDTTKKVQYPEKTISEDLIEWRNTPGNCWVSQRPTFQAKPSLKNCYLQSVNSCCNFVQDEVVSQKFHDIMPDVCLSDLKEIQLLQCMACRDDMNNYVVKANATKEYYDTISELMRLQDQHTNINRTFAQDLARPLTETHDGKNLVYDGYVKVCASWVGRMWNLTQDEIRNTQYKNLGEPTKQFDNCGAYDVDNDKAPIVTPSKFEKWQDALSFLEYYGIPHLPNFGIVIFYDSDPEEKGCFKKAKYLQIHLMAMITASVLAMHTIT